MRQIFIIAFIFSQLLSANLFCVAAPSAGDLVQVPVSEIAATQAQVGSLAVTKMAADWAAKSKEYPGGFENFLKGKILANPFPGVYGPDIWGEPTMRTYIKDGHHRASALNLILYGPYEKLPPEVRAVLSPKLREQLTLDPAMNFKVALEEVYIGREEMIIGMIDRGTGQLPSSVRLNPEFLEEMRKLRAGEKNVNVSVLLEAYQSMAKNLSDLQDSPMRSLVGIVFHGGGVDNSLLVNYAEFLQGERIEKDLAKLGFEVTTDNLNDPKLLEAAKELILGDPKNIEFLRSISRPARDSESATMLDAVWTKYRQAHPLPVEAVKPKEIASTKQAGCGWFVVVHP